MTIKKREFDSVIRKFHFQTKQTHHLMAWLEVDGQKVVRTRRSNGSGDLPAERIIRQQLHLSESEFADAVRCTLNYDGYVQILRHKGVI